METVGSPVLWAAFAVVVVVMLAIDLLVAGGGHRHRVSLREAAFWSVVWVTVSLLFATSLWWHLHSQHGAALASDKVLEFLTGYLIEKALAVDNVFIWLMLFTSLAVPVELHKRVLLYGVLGAIVMRAILILIGAWLIARAHWVLYLFGALLLVTGARMLWFADHPPDLERNPLVRLLRRWMPVTDHFDGERFFVRRDGVRHATPLFVALILIEGTDLVFAVDSIPAIFAITTDPFIVLTSNVFAILGLRAMYFLLADIADRFSLLKYGLAVMLMFIGVKMLLIDLYKIPIGLSLAVVALVIGVSVWASLRKEAHERRPPG